MRVEMFRRRKTHWPASAGMERGTEAARRRTGRDSEGPKTRPDVPVGGEAEFRPDEVPVRLRRTDSRNTATTGSPGPSPAGGGSRSGADLPVGSRRPLPDRD